MDMTQSLLLPLREARKNLGNFFRSSLRRNLFLAYTVLSFPFFCYHEAHLPIHYVLGLAFFAWLAGVVLFFLSLAVLQNYWLTIFHPGWEILSWSVFLFSLWLAEVLQFRAGKVFLVLLLSIFLFIRVARIDILAKLLLAGLWIASNGLLSFQTMQGFEVLASYNFYESKYPFQRDSLGNWESEDKKGFWNEKLSLGFDLPDEMYFFTPEDLGLKEKTGIGQIVGILSSSESDPNRYPSVRLFYLPSYIHFSSKEADQEVFGFLKIQEQKKEIEDLQEIKTEEPVPDNVGSRFWTFYDTMRPRYAKTGYILIETRSHDSLLFHITENLEKGRNHEEPIEVFLKSIRFSNTLQRE